MSIFQTITSLDDPRIAWYRNVKDGELARRRSHPTDPRDAASRFIAEGQWVVQRLLASKIPTESVLVAQRKVDQIAPLTPPTVPIYVVADALIHEVVGFKFHSGVMACGLRPESPSVSVLMAECLGPLDSPVGSKRVTLVICPDIINTQNLGALIRSAAALGADAMILGEQCCDPFFRQSVRISMGAVFTLPIARSTNLLADLKELRDRWAVDLVATVLDPAAEPLPQAQRGSRVALLLGSEDRGLGEPYFSACTRKVTLPMSRGTDSLNVAAAAAVFLYHFTRS